MNAELCNVFGCNDDAEYIVVHDGQTAAACFNHTYDLHGQPGFAIFSIRELLYAPEPVKVVRDPNYRTLQSPEATFYFHKDVALSQAKLIRDTITAQMRRSIPQFSHIPIHTVQDAREFILDNVAGPANQVLFDMEFV